MIEVKSLQKSYGPLEVLRGVSFVLRPGRVYGIVGANGAGKTTLFTCLAGLAAYNGTINPPPGQLRTRTGYLPTEPVFPSYVTGWEYLKLLCAARDLPTEDFAEQNLFDLPLDRYAEHYSTGMKKKLALFGLLLQGNGVYLLDEPFNGVDIQSNMLIREVIGRLRSAGKTVLLSSHVFSSLEENCDELFVLRDGRLGPPVGRDDYERLSRELRTDSLAGRVDRLRIT
ncbi:ATP-binding cassette domain-containing protein [Lewinella sp. IMCC34183]|uniref:ABC transporter ATP-binding protein n=1 Tax=Lewinella sp. IMCC34183 TaxID=2248762 RepID=UPI000E248325|nr:ATP-binding cassette domain-containing protein [Lewinella sp. IMCC34183]